MSIASRQRRGALRAFRVSVVCLLSAGCVAFAPHVESPVHRAPSAPRGGVALSFDDRYIEAWYAVRDLLSQYDARVTFFVTRFEGLNENQIQKLRVLQGDGHEIGCHGLRHVGPRRYLVDHTGAEYLQAEVLPAVQIMRQHGFDPKSFAYPGGSLPSIHSVLDPLLLQHFEFVRRTLYQDDERAICYGKSRRVAAAGIDVIYRRTDQHLGKLLEKAASTNGVLVLYGHKPTVAPTRGYKTSIARLEFILRTARDLHMRFFTISELASLTEGEKKKLTAP